MSSYSHSSLRPTREGPLLVLALALVLSVCIPLYQMVAGPGGPDRRQVKNVDAARGTLTISVRGGADKTFKLAKDARFTTARKADADSLASQGLKDELFSRTGRQAPFVALVTRGEGDSEEVTEVKVATATEVAEETSSTVSRLRHIFLGPEQVACYCGFTWGAFILLSRYLEVRRQRRAFGLDLLPTEEGARILPEDARRLQRKVEQQTRGKPYILASMIRLALGKYGVTRSGQEVSETVRTQADVDMSRLVSSMATVNFLAWAIPAIGFLGTVRGIGLALEDPENAVGYLYLAFDATLVALALSLPLMFLLHSVQRDEEGVVIDCQQYCLENLVARLYDVEHEHTHA